MTIAIDFNPRNYQVPNEGIYRFTDACFWAELNGDEGIFKKRKNVFHIPTQKSSKDWPDLLKAKYGIEPKINYDQEIVNLPLQVTEEQLAEGKRHRNELFTHDTEEERKEFEARPYTPEDWLSIRQGYLSIVLGEAGNQDEAYANLSDLDKKILRWRPSYGSLKGKYNVSAEYLFHVQEDPQLYLSLASEMSSNKAIWGFRRQMGLDLPIDWRNNGEDLEFVGISVPKLITSMNNLIENMENIIRA
jgi:hypothetical protein